MKKFIAILLAMLLIIVSAFTFAACNGSNGNDGTIPGKYEDVKIDTAEQKQELSDTITSKIMANLPDDANTDSIQGSDAALYILSETLMGIEQKSTLKFDANLTVDYQDMKSEFKGNVQAEDESKIRFGYSEKNGFEVTGAASATLKGGLEIPRALLTSVTGDEQISGKIAETLKEFDVSTSVYLDKNNLYFDLSQSLVDTLSNFGVDFGDGKIKIPADSGIGDFAPFAIQDSTEEAPSAQEIEAEIKSCVESGLELLDRYKIEVAVSTTDGWTLRVKATTDTVKAILEEESVPEEVRSVINKVAKFNKFDFEVYIGFDKTDKISRFSYRIDLDVDVNIQEDSIPDFPIVLSGKVKLTTGSNIQLYSGTITLPDNLGEYQDVRKYIIGY